MEQALTFAANETRWQAVVERNKQADGAFVYAVRTTGVYCRPSCPSRQPNRGNVAFFPDCDAAEQASFRACKRCQPHVSVVSAPHTTAIARACTLIEQAEVAPHLNELAQTVGLSPYYFHRLFKQTIGITPHQYANAHRLRRVQQQLQHDSSVTEALYNAGFASSSTFYEHVDALGMTPTQYRNGARGQHIRYGLSTCYLGWVLVAATERGICMIDLADDPVMLAERLHKRFPHATLADDPEFAAQVVHVVAYIDLPAASFDLPLDILGTAFQQQVWAALQSIPTGTTVTYSEVAVQIGNPAAVRAVAGACAANTVAVVIPCHRVVRSNGELSGYRWGIERKRALIEREASAAELVAKLLP